MSAQTKKKWYKLDNAGKLYPAIATSRWSSVFRLSAVLTENVDPAALQLALDKVLHRFPTMAVRMRRGVFWYYLEANYRRLMVLPDTGHPCMPVQWKDNNGYLLRVLFYRKRISVEFFHSITDGTGGFIFLKTLVAEYLRMRGYRIPCGEGVLDLKKKPSLFETEDAFQRMPLPSLRRSRRESRAFHFPAQAEPPHTVHLICATMPFPAVNKQSKALGVTVTEYLAAVMLYVGYCQQRQEKKPVRPIRISIPVNMRNYFKTETVRNFSSYVNPEIDPRLGDYTFEEIAKNVHAFMQYALNPKFLYATIATNVANEKNLFLRLCPLPLKNLAINTVFRYVGERAMTATLTSVGRMQTPEAMAAHIDRFELALGASASPGCNCALVSTGNKMVLMFSRNQRETTLSREMLRFLVEQGIPITVESNQE